MFFHKNKYNILFRTIAMVLVCLFCTNTIIIASPDTLAPLAGNPKVYQEMRTMMEERLAEHQEPIDEFIKQNSGKAKGLSAIPYLEEELMQCVNACGANNMLARLKTTLISAGGKIQIISVKSEDELPVFEGRKVWGHAGTYVTVFALEGEKDSKDGRRKIIGRLFHEIRARSTKAKELFDNEFGKEKPTTPEGISAFIKLMREIFEKDNLQIQNQIEQSASITNSILRQEFANLTFAAHPDVMNRDYVMGKERQKDGNAGTPNSPSSIATSLKYSDSLVSVVMTLIHEANDDEKKLQDISFDLARLLLSSHGSSFSFRIGSDMLNIQSYPVYYRRVLKIYGEALVIASSADPSLKHYFKPRFCDNPPYFNYNQRNSNRLAGFYRNEEFAMDFVQTFIAEPKGGGSYSVDSQIAILDAIDGIEFKTGDLLNEVIAELKSQLKDEELWSPIIRERLRNLVASLVKRGVVQGATYNEQLIEKFDKLKKVNPEETNLFKALQLIQKRGYVTVDFKYGSDPLELVAGIEPLSEEYLVRLQKTLTKTRINYRQANSNFEEDKKFSPEEKPYNVTKLTFWGKLQCFFTRRPINKHDFILRTSTAMWSATFIIQSIATISELSNIGAISALSLSLTGGSLILLLTTAFYSFRLISSNFTSLVALESLEKEFDSYYAEVKSYLEEMKDGAWTKDPKAFFEKIEEYIQKLRKMNEFLCDELVIYSIPGTPLAHRRSNLNSQISIVTSHLGNMQMTLTHFYQQKEGLNNFSEEIYKIEKEFESKTEEIYIPESDIKERFAGLINLFEEETLPSLEKMVEKENELRGLDKNKWIARLAQISEDVSSAKANLDYLDQEGVFNQELELIKKIGKYLTELDDDMHIVHIKGSIDLLLHLCERQGKHRFGWVKEENVAGKPLVKPPKGSAATRGSPPPGSIFDALETIEWVMPMASDSFLSFFTKRIFQENRINPVTKKPFSNTTIHSELSSLIVLGILERSKNYSKAFPGAYETTDKYKKASHKVKAAIKELVRPLPARPTESQLKDIEPAIRGLLDGAIKITADMRPAIKSEAYTSEFRLPQYMLWPLPARSAENIRSELKDAINKLGGIDAIKAMDSIDFGRKLAELFGVGFIDVANKGDYEKIKHLLKEAGVKTQEEFVKTVEPATRTFMFSRENDYEYEVRVEPWQKVLLDKGSFPSYIITNSATEKRSNFYVTALHEIVEILVARERGTDGGVLSVFGHNNMLVLGQSIQFAYQLGMDVLQQELNSCKEIVKDLDEKTWSAYGVTGIKYKEFLNQAEAFLQMALKQLDATNPNSIKATPQIAQEQLAAFEKEWQTAELDRDQFLSTLSPILGLETILDHDKPIFVFSEKVAFDNNLVKCLPKLVAKGIKVAVIVKTGREKAKIDELNAGKTNDKHILQADTIEGIREEAVKVKISAPRFYYFRIKDSTDLTFEGRNITMYELTPDMVKRIIDAIGTASKVQPEKLPLLREIARKFAEAA